MRQIVKKTPFIRQGELRSADAVKEEKLLANIKLSEL
jgi:hypothetical protein